MASSTGRTVRSAAACRAAAQAVRRRVHQTEAGVGADAEIRRGAVGMQLAEHFDPQLDILTLQAPHAVAVLVAEAREVAILDPDDIGVVQREVDVERHEGGEPDARVALARQDVAAAAEELLAHLDEDRAEQRLLVGEVPVHRRAADADRSAEVFEADAAEAALGEEPAQPRAGWRPAGRLSRGRAQ